MHSHSEWRRVSDDHATMKSNFLNQLALQSMQGTTSRRDHPSAKNIFFIDDDTIITNARIGELMREEERDGIEIKNKFSALKKHFFLDKKKLI